MQSRHFQLEELASGVLAATHKRGGLGICNAGIIDLGDRTLIFDTMLAPKAAVDLSLTAETLFNRPVSLVINSHYHNDHIWGNQIFSEDVDIISTQETRNQILTIGKRDLSDYKEHAPDELETHIRKIDTLDGPEDAENEGLWIEFLEATVESMGRIRLRVPNLTFQSRMMIHGSLRVVELIEFNYAHTHSDCILFLPEERICFAGDVVTFNTHPYLSEAHPEKIRLALQAIRDLNPVKVVPGHGAIDMPEKIDQIICYLQHLEDTARQSIRDDLSWEYFDQASLPGEFSGWEFGNLYVDNLRHYWTHYTTGEIAGPVAHIPDVEASP